MATLRISGEAQHGADRAGDLLVLLLLDCELLPAGRRERVETGAAVVLRRAPLAADVAVEQESLQRGVQRALTNLEDLTRDLAQSLRNPVAVHRPALKRAEDEEIERPR